MLSGVALDAAYQALTTDVPASAAADGTITVEVAGGSQPIVSEIALEHKTVAGTAACTAVETPNFSDIYGSVTLAGQPAPPGTLIQAFSLAGDPVGCFVVDTAGQYGFMRLYGRDDSVSPEIPGMDDDQVVLFRVNGQTAVPTPLYTWHDNKSNRNVDLAAGNLVEQTVVQQPGWNLSSFYADPPYPSVPLSLQSLNNRYDRVLGESGVFDPAIDPIVNTLDQLHCGQGYYVHITGTVNLPLTVEGAPVAADTPLPLHAGWNWAGYLPTVTLPISDALQSIDGQYQLVHSLDKTYDPTLPHFSTLLDMNSGDGYLIYANSSLSLTYPAGPAPDLPATTAGSSIIEPVGDTACESVPATPYFMNVYGQVELFGEPAAVGTKVEIITPRDEVAGCAILDSPGLLRFTRVYGNGSDDGGSPGFLPGEPLAFQINGLPVADGPALNWQDDWLGYEVQLAIDTRSVYLPIISR